jgi:hypothetical protein
LYTTEQLRNLNPERLELLAGELESGKYLKGENTLCLRENENAPWRMCCMGVGTALAIEQGWVNLTEDIRTQSSPRYNFQYKMYRQADGREESLTFPPEVRDLFGFPINNPDLPLPDGVQDLRNLEDPSYTSMGVWNDQGPGRAGAEPDFTTIAAAIRKLAQMAREAQTTSMPDGN